MEILIACLFAYMFVSPDKMSLALSRGVIGAGRGALTGKTPKVPKQSKRHQAMLAGWREGIARARERREAGRDVWARGTRLAGRVSGGTASLVRGIDSTVKAHRTKDDSSALDGNSSPDAVPSRRGWIGPRLVLRPKTAPTSDASGAVVDEDGRDVTKGSDPDTGGTADAAPKPAPLRVVDGDTDPRTTELDALKAEAKKAEDIVAGTRPSLHSTAGENARYIGSPDRYDYKITAEEAEAKTRKIAEGDTEQAAAARRLLKHLDHWRQRRDELNAEIARREALNSTATSTTRTNTAPNGVITMPAPTELNTLDELARELKTMENVFTDLAAAMERAKAWGKNLPDRWEATPWGTRDLDRAIGDISEEVAGIRLPALESFASARTALVKARALGETADAVKARGKTEAFRAQ